ncbi:methionine synthase [Schleiferilactobacillus perolens DSM 12744]|uniref:Methionine synthase n=2 Tax=Schleiferilactobacillus perolens TaxID=100468 RepID=A0A0R1MXV8_9LACO|nr:methionine synthase [Schleiferilactobacillus perolens DSM 12744]
MKERFLMPSTLTKTVFPYRYDLVGSLLRPARLHQARADFAAHKIDRAALTQVADEEIKKIVDQQVALGFKDVTDGEFRRSWWHLDFYAGLKGTEFFTPTDGWAFSGGESRAGGVRVNAPLAYNPDHPFFAGFKYLQSIVPEGITAKQTIPSPSVFFPSEPAHIINDYYDDVQDFYDALIPTYQHTLQHFYDLGCRYLQLDDTAWGMWASFAHNAHEKVLQPEWAVQAKEAVRVINAIVADKPKDLTITMHICRGNYKSQWAGAGAYDPVADYLAQLNIDGFFLEYDDERSGGFEPLAKISANGRHQRIVLGLVTSKRPALEDESGLRARIKKANEFVPLADLCLSTQCGFASTEEGNALSAADQWAKLALVAKTAQDTWSDAE